jgi:DNA-binding transcriptional MerR regulator
MSVANLLTVGQIAQRAGVPIHRVEYFISSRKISPVARAGQLRIFAEDVVEQIQEARQDRRNRRVALTA